MRYFIEFAYDGTNYFGYQIQPNQISVQEVLESKLSTLLRKEIKITGAGRTDTGVHAHQMFAHFDTENQIPNDLGHKLNSFLPKDIVINDIFRVNDDAHARFDAEFRTYKYYISTKRNPFDYQFSYPIFQNLDVQEMQKSANKLLNHSDFKSFSKLHSDNKTTICNVTEAFFETNENQIIFTITANRFLRNMVRAVVGTLIEVGKGKINTNEFNEIINSKKRSEAGTSAPANALFLYKITYPNSILQL
ncbi:MAG: tRNA pseudouridine(38-40) synthase TruA [Flavobacteriales bacterium]|nr:tRNA pseudouridine(38-40) synthase TruA [Flavobacteriales bacterium]